MRARLENARLDVVCGAQCFGVETQPEFAGQYDFRYAADDAGRVASPCVVVDVGHAT